MAQRTKGAAYERELVHLFNARLGIELKRNIGQARDGGNDISAGALVIEAKRRKTLTTIESWLEQAERAAWARRADGQRAYPVVITRADRGENILLMYLDDAFEVFGDVLRELVTEEAPV